MKNVIGRAGAVVVCMLVLSCGGAVSMVVKPPVVSRCEETGLKGCDEITEGVLLWAEGKKAEAREHLRAGIAKNSSTRVRRYAATLKIVASMPGISQYAEPIREVCDLLADETGGPISDEEEKAAAAPQPQQAAKSDPETTAMDTAKDHGLQTLTAMPWASEKTFDCKPFSAYEPAVAAAKCLRVATGPLIVTDVHVGAGCPDEVFILAGRMSRPRWFLIASTTGLAAHGARFMVKPDEPLMVGVRATGEEQDLAKDPRCSVTWAAVEP